MNIPTILSGAAGRALRTLEPLESIARAGTPEASVAARALVNRARPDIAGAVSPARVRSLSAELHAAAANAGSGLGSTTAIANGLAELSRAASRTATRRVTVGTLALGAGIGGIAALAARGDGPVIMAPGSPGSERSPGTPS